MFDLPGYILILTGPPGSGKSTTASLLVAASRGPAVHVHSDDFWRFIKKGAIPPYLPESQRQNEMVMRVVAQAAKGYAGGGYFVIVDGIVGPWFLYAFRALLQPLHYVVLRPDRYAAIQRCRERGGDALSDPETIRALHQQFCGLGELESHVIETAGHDREETLAAVEAALVSRRFRLGATN